MTDPRIRKAWAVWVRGGWPEVAAALVAANVPHLARLPVREAAE